MIDSSELKSSLGHFTGTTAYTRRNPFHNNFVLTDGANFLAEKAECDWLFNAIHTRQDELAKDPQLRDYQFWTLKVNKDNSARLVCERDKDDVAIEIDFTSTDFPLDEVKIWVCPGEIRGRAVQVAMLPSEY